MVTVRSVGTKIITASSSLVEKTENSTEGVADVIA